MPRKEDKNYHPILKAKRSFGQKAADKFTGWVGSWTFIFIFLSFLFIWITLNGFWFLFGKAWDPRPFIMLNLILSMIAALQAPLILMSQNRASQIDRIRATYDYAVNRKAEREIERIQQQLDRIEKNIR